MIRLKILLGRLAALAGPVNKMLTDENQVGAGDKDAGLCNNEPGKYPEWRRRGGRAAAAAMWRLHGDGDARMGKHGAAATRLGSAPICRSILLPSPSLFLLSLLTGSTHPW